MFQILLQVTLLLKKVEQFWSLYCYMSHPCDLPPHCDIHVFKMGIKPMWEVPIHVISGYVHTNVGSCQ